MLISGISSLLQAYSPSTQQTSFQQFQQEFLKLGQDLQSGNLAQAQGDFATLQQNAPAGSAVAASSATATSSTISQEFYQLAQDLQSGNLSAAQSDYSNIQQTAQQNGLAGMLGHHHHHRHHVSGSSQGTSAINQDLSQLGQDLQAGNIQSAQQAYATLQQDFQQFMATSGSGAGIPVAPQAGINISI